MSDGNQGIELAASDSEHLISTTNQSVMTASTTQLGRGNEDPNFVDIFEMCSEVPTLGVDQVEMAKKLVNKQHPLSKIPLSKALPFLGFFGRWFGCVDAPLDSRFTRMRSSVELAEAESQPTSLQHSNTLSDEQIRQDEEMEAEQRTRANQNASNDEQSRSDPVNVYGAGLKNYFVLQDKLLWLFFFLSIGALAQMCIYKSFNGLGSLGEYVTTTASLSFGNMGFSGTTCSKMPIDWENDQTVTMNVTCQQTTHISSVFSSGMMLDQAFPGGEMDAVHDCYIDPKNETQMNSFEMRQFRKDNFESIMRKECLGKNHCSVKLPFYEFASTPAHAQRLNMILFTQMECKQTDKILLTKQVWGMAVAFIGVYMCYVFAATVRTMLNLDKINDKLLDLELTTVDDYTAQTRLSSKIYKKFLKEQNFSDDDVPIFKFKEMLIESIRHQLVTFCGLTHDKTEIVDIHFSFNNMKITNKLSERAEALKAAEFEKLQKIQAEMTEVKNKHFDELNTPNYMWITFKHDIAIQAIFNKKTIKLFDAETELKRAQHPTDILFDNREITKTAHGRRKFCAVTFYAIFGVFFWYFGIKLIKAMQIISFMQQPPLTSCTDVRQKYDEEALFSLAFQEFNHLKANRLSKNLNLNNAISRTGALYCFCEHEIAESDGTRFQNYKFEYTDPESKGKDVMEAPICKVYYFYMTGPGYIIEQSFNYLIVIMSYVIRTVFIMVAEKVRFFSLTDQTKFVMRSVFLITFLNYGIIYLCASWDQRNDNLLPTGYFFNGLYPDFNALWFNDVGVLIVQIMISNAYWPPLEFFLFYGERLLYRMIDQRSLFPTNPQNTRCKTVQAFEDIYAGPNFTLDYKYSYILVVVFVTFTFGAGLPILFPIAYVSLLGLYITERLMIAYSYRKPPMYGTSINQSALNTMLGAPVCYAVVAAWMFSNQQVFENVVTPTLNGKMFPDTEHTLGAFFGTINPGTIYFAFLILYALFGIGQMLTKCVGFKTEQIEDETTKQQLIPFTKAIRHTQCKGFVAEEKVCRQKLGFKRLPESSFEQLVEANIAGALAKKFSSVKNEGKLQGVHTYNILANETYFKRYLYQPYSTQNRAEQIVSVFKHPEMRLNSVDLVRYACDLAFLQIGRAKAFEFTPKYVYTEQQARLNPDGEKAGYYPVDAKSSDLQ